MRRPVLIMVMVGSALAAAGCDSTQEKASRLAASSGEAFEKTGLRVTKENPDVEVVKTWTLTDPNGTAVAVRVRNTTQKRLVGVPIALDVQDAAKQSVFRNDDPGLDPSLVELPVLRAGETVTWVNDQVVPAGEAKATEAKIGVQRSVMETEEPRLTLQQIERRSDADGAVVTGFVMNKSDVDQRNVVVYGVATKDGDVVAAGRGQVQRVRPGRRAKFNVFFIGDPSEGTLDLAVPATTLEPEGE